MNHFKSSINSKAFLCNLFASKHMDQNKKVIPSKRLNAVRSWLNDINIVQYQTHSDQEYFCSDTEADHTDCDLKSVSESDNDSHHDTDDTNADLELKCDNALVLDESDDDIEDDFEYAQAFDNREGYYYSDYDGAHLVHKYDYAYKCKRLKDMNYSTLIQKSCDKGHNRYGKTRKYSKYKYCYVDVGGLKVKTKAKRYNYHCKFKYPKKEYFKRQFKRR